MRKLISSALLIITFLLFTNVKSIAQNEDLKYLDDGGYSQISNYVSIDVAKLFTHSLTIRLEHSFGKHFVLTGGVSYSDPNSGFEFRFDHDYVYKERTFYPKKPGFNFFAEASGRMYFDENKTILFGVGYRNTKYDVAVMNDIYLKLVMVVRLNTTFFIGYGIEIGPRFIEYNDIIYNPDGATGVFLEDYNKWYEEEVNTNTITAYPHFSFGFMF